MYDSYRRSPSCGWNGRDSGPYAEGLAAFQRDMGSRKTVIIASVIVLAFLSLPRCTSIKTHSPISKTDHPTKIDKREKYNVILISIDTLRADHLSSYGYFRETSPNIDHLAAEGILFEQAISQSNWTLPSHASLLTSRFVASHGLYIFSRRLSDAELTLAEILKRHGYDTGAFTSSVNLKPRWGFSQGFDTFFNSDSTKGSFKSIFPKAVEWLRSKKDRRFFMFLHANDVLMAKSSNPPSPPRSSEAAL